MALMQDESSNPSVPKKNVFIVSTFFSIKKFDKKRKKRIKYKK
jgi:hypothetical protein